MNVKLVIRVFVYNYENLSKKEKEKVKIDLFKNLNVHAMNLIKRNGEYRSDISIIERRILDEIDDRLYLTLTMKLFNLENYSANKIRTIIRDNNEHDFTFDGKLYPEYIISKNRWNIEHIFIDDEDKWNNVGTNVSIYNRSCKLHSYYLYIYENDIMIHSSCIGDGSRICYSNEELIELINKKGCHQNCHYKIMDRSNNVILENNFQFHE
jgi:hypothetical protein